MTYPPQQPWQGGPAGHGPQGSAPWGQQPPGGQQWGASQPGQPQPGQWGGQPPQWGGQGQQPPGPPQWGGQQGQWGGSPPTGQGGWGQPQGQGQWGQQPAGQQFVPPPPRKSKLGLWLGIGGGAVLVVVLVVVLVLTLGGGDYAGKTKPALPGGFGGWQRGEGVFGMVEYRKGADSVTVYEFEPQPDATEEVPTVEPPEDVPDVDLEQSKPADGVHCVTTTDYGTSCLIAYEDNGGFVVTGRAKSTTEDAAVALAEAA